MAPGRDPLAPRPAPTSRAPPTNARSSSTDHADLSLSKENLASPGAYQAASARTPRRSDGHTRQFVSGPGSTAGGLLLVGTGYLVVETLVALLYAVLGSQLRRIVISARADRLVARVTGVCLIGFAAYLGTSRRPT
nr:hypothetical protein GCM10010200_035160 [Actinomadura rugatobispora]